MPDCAEAFKNQLIIAQYNIIMNLHKIVRFLDLSSLVLILRRRVHETPNISPLGEVQDLNQG